VGWKTLNAAAADTVVSGTLTTGELELSRDRMPTLNLAMPADSSARVVVEVLAPDGAPIDSAELRAGGVAVPVPLTRDIPSAPVRLRVTMEGGPAPDRIPRLFAIEY
jgi:hypothetical protein